jgi:hypothetical protein
VDANARGQDLKREGKFSLARVLLRKCADPSCPDIVKGDCTKRLDDLENAQPSIVFDVTDARGTDIFDVRVSVDDGFLTDHLDGKPLIVDPGLHTFKFELAGLAPVVSKLLIKEGEARRHERVVFGGGEGPARPQVAPQPTATTPTPQPTATTAPTAQPTATTAATVSPPPVTSGATPPPPAQSSGMSSKQTIGLTLGGIGIVGVGVGVAFGVMAGNAWTTAKNACGGTPSNCIGDVATANSNHDTAVTDGTIATGGVIVGGALLVTGIVLFATGGNKAPEGKAASVTVEPMLGPGTQGLGIRGVF